MISNYTSERDIKGNTYFKQYPDGSNIAALWKKFGSVKIEHDDKIKNIQFRLFDMINPDELSMIIMQSQLLFKNYNVQFLDKTPKTLIITPKEPLDYKDNIEGITDVKTTKIISNEQYQKMQASTGFVF